MHTSSGKEAILKQDVPESEREEYGRTGEMIFDRNEKKEVIALLGAGSMGTAIVRRIAAGRKILLGDISEKNLEKVSHDSQEQIF